MMIYSPTNNVLGFIFSPHSHQHFLFVLFFILAILTCEVVAYGDFDLHSVMISDVENLFMYLLAICTFSWEKCRFRYSARFLSGFFFLY